MKVIFFTVAKMQIFTEEKESSTAGLISWRVLAFYGYVSKHVFLVDGPTSKNYLLYLQGNTEELKIKREKY